MTDQLADKQGVCLYTMAMLAVNECEGVVPHTVRMALAHSQPWGPMVLPSHGIGPQPALGPDGVAMGTI